MSDNTNNTVNNAIGDTRKLCINCKWYERMGDECHHVNNLDLVHNQPRIYPYTLRYNSYYCGLKGTWFEPKPINDVEAKPEEVKPKRWDKILRRFVRWY